MNILMYVSHIAVSGYGAYVKFVKIDRNFPMIDNVSIKSGVRLSILFWNTDQIDW